MKVAIIGDSHWGARNDSQAFMDYFRKFYEEVFFPTLQERGIDTIIHMGDVVDRRKFINWKTTFQMREIFFDVCSDRGIKLHLIAGNHDSFFRNTLVVNSLDGLRLGDNENFTVYEKSTEIELDGTKFFMQPWICDENREHWSDYKDAKGFHIFDTETREVEVVLNPLEMFHKIYYDDEQMTIESIQNDDYSVYTGCYVKIIIVNKKNPFCFDTLMDKLYGVDVADISVAENFDQDLNLEDDMIDEAEDTSTILSKYVNSLNIDNKKELDNLLISLYNESLTLETL